MVFLIISLILTLINPIIMGILDKTIGTNDYETVDSVLFTFINITIPIFITTIIVGIIISTILSKLWTVLGYISFKRLYKLGRGNEKA